MKKILAFLFISLFLTNCSKLNFFGFGEEKNLFEKNNISESLWKSTETILSNYPNVQKNITDALISTDWIKSKKNSNIRFRIAVYILGSDAIEENIEILVDKEKNINGQWVQIQTSSAFNQNLKRIILSRAKNLDSETYGRDED